MPDLPLLVFGSDYDHQNRLYSFASFDDTMVLLEGRALFSSVTVLTCLGFLLIGYDNGLMGGQSPSADMVTKDNS